MILEIKKYPDPVLRKKCGEVKTITPEIKELVFNMGESMAKDKGVGLAAPQVGVLKRIIVVQGIQGPDAYINPRIVKKSRGKDFMEEGCLSFPDVFLQIKRPKEVEVEALNLQGEKIRVKARDLAARVFQHEIDHLDGILFIDRISFFQRLLFKLRPNTQKHGTDR